MEVIKKAEDNMYKIKSIDSPSMRWNTINTILLTFHEKNEREQLHSNRVSELCINIATAMGLSEKEISDLGIIGLMHDIGKIAIDDNILNKEERLSNEEWEELKKHPSTGYRILSASNNMAFIAKYVLSHHERLDGSGYPYGLKGNEIPLQSRILAIADSYDAMTSKRTYKDVLTKNLAVKELLRNSGTQFDSDIVKIFIEDVLKTEVA
jgi:HD-GYP domain-containing protein (c-di-GMP phosphodiesterase class II)